jgi:hypothetical protein
VTAARQCWIQGRQKLSRVVRARNSVAQDCHRGSRSRASGERDTTDWFRHSASQSAPDSPLPTVRLSRLGCFCQLVAHITHRRTVNVDLTLRQDDVDLTSTHGSQDVDRVGLAAAALLGAGSGHADRLGRVARRRPRPRPGATTVSTTASTTSRKHRPHRKPPSAGMTSTRSSGSPKFEWSEQRQRIEDRT